MEANAALVEAICYHGGGSESDRLPHEYPMGGSGGRGRWSM
jgi:hypothetical protein